MFKQFSNFVTFIVIILVVSWFVGHLYGEYKLVQIKKCIEIHTTQECQKQFNWSRHIIVDTQKR